jgi:hypothetical protein
MDKLPLNYAQMRRLDASPKPIDYYYYYTTTLYAAGMGCGMLYPQFAHIVSRHASRGKTHGIRGKREDFAV